MKKILYIMLALVALLTTSCSNDDIIIETEGAHQKLTYSISTQNMYNEFSIYNDITKILRDGSYCVGVSTYVYNSQGNLVTTRYTGQYNLNNIQENFTELPEGKYTFVTIETLSNTQDKFDIEIWGIENTEKLSTLKITQKYDKIAFPYAIGVATNTVTIKSGNNTVNAIPTAIGSIVTLTFLNFDESPYEYVGLETEDMLNHYLIDPTIERSEKFKEDLTKSGYTNLRIACLISGSSSITESIYILECRANECFAVRPAGITSWSNWPSNETNVTLEDGASYYAGAYYKGEHTPFDVYFGDQSGYNAWYKKVTEDTSNDNNNTDDYTFSVPDVYKTWGASVNSVQSFMNGYTMSVGTSGHAILQENGLYAISYNGKGTEENINYFFEKETSGLIETVILYNQSDVEYSTLKELLTAKYKLVEEEDDEFIYISSDESTYILLLKDSESYYLSYVDANYLTSSSASKRIKLAPRKAEIVSNIIK